MDDYNITSLNNSQHEWAVQILNTLTPYIIEGINSIFDEAYKLCIENREKEKYLMTFQNLLARIPKWNNTIIEEETKRIVDKSKCLYLEDLISCVHISHLKILTSMRVTKTQKKININVPVLKDFIHKVYIHCGRKLYTVTYLFERDIEPLIMQKNRKEIEDHVNNAILNAIRESIPVEEILKAYMDESTDLIASVNKDVIVEEQEQPKTMSEAVVKNEPVEVKNDPVEVKNEPVEIKEAPIVVKEAPIVVQEALAPPPTPVVNKPDNVTLSFSEIDKAISVDKVEESVSAPKDVATLEKISDENHKKRKEEEEEEEEEDEGKLVISDDKIDLNPLDINEIKMKIDENPLLSDIEVLM
tara:strand:- start:3849 stop:4922 length:1074 start_codon:yes stop_codon:yes gene_type:complete